MIEQKEVGCPHIYYIYSKKDNKGYIGRDNGNSYERITKHIYDAYTSKDGKGAEQIIKERSASGCSYREFKAPNFGLSNEIYDSFLSLWTPVGEAIDIQETKLNIAEILHIFYHFQAKDNMSAANIQIGSYQMSFEFNWGNLKDGLKLKQSLEAFLEDNKEYNVGRQLNSKIVVSPYNPKEIGGKLLDPVRYRILEFVITKMLNDINIYKPIIVEYVKELLGLRKRKVTFKKQIKFVLEKRISEINVALSKYFGEYIQIKLDIDNFVIEEIETKLKSFIKSRFYNKKTIQAIVNKYEYRNTDNTISYSKAILTQLSEIIQLIVSKIVNLKPSEDTWSIPIPARAVRVSIPKKQPKWYTLLIQELKPWENMGSENKITNAAKRASFKAFNYIYEEKIQKINPFSIGEKVPYIEGKSFLVNYTKEKTLSYRIREIYRENGVRGEILHSWSSFYSSFISYILDPIVVEDNSNAISMYYIDTDQEAIYMTGQAERLKNLFGLEIYQFFIY